MSLNSILLKFEEKLIFVCIFLFPMVVLAQSPFTVPPQSLDLEATQIQLNPSVIQKNKFDLRLPSGDLVTLERESLVQNKGSRTWFGHVVGDSNSNVHLTFYRGSLTGKINYLGQTFELASNKSGDRRYIYEVDYSLLPDLSKDSVALEASPDSLDTNDGSHQDSVFADASQQATIDVLFVYTPGSVAKWGIGKVENKILSAINLANQSYANSGIGVTLRLAGMSEVNYNNDTDFYTALSDLRYGRVSQAHELRNQLGADMVTMMISGNAYCGLGYYSISPYEGNMFSVFNGNCVNVHVVAHELGHNMGAHHNEEDAGMDTDYRYGYRHCFTGGYLTVMSYNCSGASRVTQFSNPDIYYNDLPTGTASHNNAKQINAVRHTIAGFRQSQICEESSSLAPYNLSALVEGNNVKLSWLATGSNQDQLVLERSLDQTTWVEMAQLPGDVQAFNDNNLSYDTSYFYRLKLINCFGSSDYSSVVGLKTDVYVQSRPEAFFAKTSIEIQEGSNVGETTALPIELRISGEWHEPIVVALATEDGAATIADNDYIKESTKITFEPGQVSKQVVLYLVQDTNRESNEVFYINLVTEHSGATVKLPITILNDESKKSGGKTTDGGGGRSKGKK